MQSTGQTATQDASLVPMQGSAITYAIDHTPFHVCRHTVPARLTSVCDLGLIPQPRPADAEGQGPLPARATGEPFLPVAYRAASGRQSREQFRLARRAPAG